MLYRTYQCPFCQKSFRDEYMHRFHVLKEHDTIDSRKVRRKYICRYRNLNLKTRSWRYLFWTAILILDF